MRLALLLAIALALRADEPSVEQLISRLGADDCATREAAQQELLRRGEGCLGALVKAVESEDAEVHARASEVIETILWGNATRLSSGLEIVLRHAVGGGPTDLELAMRNKGTIPLRVPFALNGIACADETARPFVRGMLDLSHFDTEAVLETPTSPDHEPMYLSIVGETRCFADDGRLPKRCPPPPIEEQVTLDLDSWSLEPGEVLVARVDARAVTGRTNRSSPFEIGVVVRVACSSDDTLYGISAHQVRWVEVVHFTWWEESNMVTIRRR